MQAYANALLIAIPSFTLLILVEVLFKIFIKKIKVNHMDIISSLSSGITNVIKDSMKLVFILIPYPFLLNHMQMFDLSNLSFGWTAFIVFLGYDFASYWNHRLNHKVNVFWNRHVIHHSSEEFNLACALRQSISEVFSFFAILILPLAILGIPYPIVALVAPIHLFMQFWYHTEHIPKLGFLEYIIVTPSQHRVHHAINPEYIDKNLSAIFCVWDRIFGTFQEELDTAPPVYGVLKPAATWNPVHINFQHYFRILTDAWHTEKWYDKLRIWFMPTGWRPEDVTKKYPRTGIDNVYEFRKYDHQPNNKMVFWSYFQLISTASLLMYLFYDFTRIYENYQAVLFYAAMIFVSVYGFTTIMDEKKHGLWIEISRSIVGLLYVYINQSWFGIGLYFMGADYVVVAYFIITLIGSIWITNEFGDKPTKRLAVN